MIEAEHVGSDVDEIAEALAGRTLVSLMAGSEARSGSGRPLSWVFRDVETGEFVVLMAVMGAIEVNVFREVPV